MITTLAFSFTFFCLAPQFFRPFPWRSAPLFFTSVVALRLHISPSLPLMLAPFRPPNKKRLRMDLTPQVDGKEKSPTKGFFKRISSSFRSPFSQKKVYPPQLTEDDSYSDEGDYGDDVDVTQPSDAAAVSQPPSDGPQFSHEEERLAFLAKGKSLLNTPRPFRNLIGDSATWREDDWSTTVGKSIPWTPVNKPKLYPD